LRDSVSKIVSVAVLVAVENAATGAFRESVQDQFDSWSEWQDLNLRPPSSRTWISHAKIQNHRRIWFSVHTTDDVRPATRDRPAWAMMPPDLLVFETLSD
jgi:hypothetical protein